MFYINTWLRYPPRKKSVAVFGGCDFLAPSPPVFWSCPFPLRLVWVMAVVLGLVVVCALCLALGLGVVVGVVLPLFIGRGIRENAKEVSAK